MDFSNAQAAFKVRVCPGAAHDKKNDPCPGTVYPRPPVVFSPPPTRDSLFFLPRAQDRTTLELIRSYAIFRLCTVRPLVSNARPLLALSTTLLGRALTARLIKLTFFHQFCAGEDEEDIKPTLARLRMSGIGAILDYAAESDIPAQATGTGSPGSHPPARTAPPTVTSPAPPHASAAASAYARVRADETELDYNLAHTILGVRAARDAGGFAAVKLTALGRPELLQRVSSLLHAHRRAFRALLPAAGGEAAAPASLSSSSAAAAPNNPYTDQRISREAFVRRLSSPLSSSSSSSSSSGGAHPAPLSESAASSLFSAIDYAGDGEIDYLEWQDAATALVLGPAEGAEAFLAAAGLGTSGGVGVARLTTLLRLDDDVHGPQTPDEEVDTRARWAAARARSLSMVEAAAECRVTVMIDAEQTYLQPAIDALGTQLQRQFNRRPEASRAWLEPAAVHVSALGGNGAAAAAALPPWARAPPHADPAWRVARNERFGRGGGGGGGGGGGTAAAAASPPAPDAAYPVVYNTLQAYLRDTPSRLSLSLWRAEREGYLYGAKLVRGAYMLQERARAGSMGYNDPIHATAPDTHACYDACAETLLGGVARGSAEVMIASHNEASIARVVDRMRALGLDPTTGGVSFGQLLGMCDHVSLSLGAQRYSVHKYVPYGPVHDVVPYLLRRAQENSDMLGGVGKELRLLRGEILRRATG
jgi:hypothetical protein